MPCLCRKPITAVDSQPIPTTSNVNQFLGAGFDDLPHVRFLDVEGEDGGLPLMEYCKSEGISLGPTANLSPEDIIDFVKTVFANCDPAVRASSLVSSRVQAHERIGAECVL